FAINAFCPTGEGGGQDNSCPSHLSKLKEHFPGASTARLQSMYDRLERGEMSFPHPWRVGKEVESATPKSAQVPGRSTSFQEVASKAASMAGKSKHGVVQLHELHDQLGRPDLPSFHAAIRQMWQGGHLQVMEAEGRGGTSQRENETALRVPSSRAGGTEG